MSAKTCLLCSALAIYLATAAISPSKVQPSIKQHHSILHVESDLIDLGSVHDLSSLKAEFEISCNGPNEIIISDVFAGCSCLSHTISKQKLLSGDSAKLSVTWDLKGNIGLHEENILILYQTNDQVSIKTLKVKVLIEKSS